MSSLKILADQFAKFVELASSKGKIGTALYKVTGENITAMTALGDIGLNVSFVSDIDLSGSQYDYSGEEMLLPIKDNKMFLEVLKGFGNVDVHIYVENNYVIIENESSRAELSISSPDMIRNKIDKRPNLSYSTRIMLSANTLKKVFKNMSKLDSTYVFLKVESGMLYITTGQENLDKITEKIEVDLPDMNVKFNKTLGHAIELLEGEVQVGIANDYPMTIQMECEGMMINYYIINCD